MSFIFYLQKKTIYSKKKRLKLFSEPFWKFNCCWAGFLALWSLSRKKCAWDTWSDVCNALRNPGIKEGINNYQNYHLPIDWLLSLLYSFKWPWTVSVPVLHNSPFSFTLYLVFNPEFALTYYFWKNNQSVLFQ